MLGTEEGIFGSLKGKCVKGSKMQFQIIMRWDLSSMRAYFANKMGCIIGPSTNMIRKIDVATSKVVKKHHKNY